VQVNASPVLFDFVVSVDVVNTGIDLPEANVKIRGGGGGGGGGCAPGCGDPACPGAEAGPAEAATSVPEGGLAGDDAPGAGGVLPPAIDGAAPCSEVFAFGDELALSRAVSEPGLDAAFDELDGVGGEEQLS
jgi:hypothetical protein